MAELQAKPQPSQMNT